MGYEGAVVDTPADPDSKFYAMDSRLRGKVFIFNQVTFRVPILTREGSDRDVERLLETLPLLGFAMEHIQVFVDSTASEIQSVAANICSDKSLKQYDCLVVIFLTHGLDNKRLMATDTSFYLYDFIEKFTPGRLPAMAGKPKLFIVEACRGEKMDQGIKLRKTVSSWSSCAWTTSSSSTFSVSSNVVGSSHLAADPNVRTPVDNHCYTYPEFADFLITTSTHRGHASFRNRQHGSWFIQELCNVIERFDPLEDSILDILTATNRAVSKRISFTNYPETHTKKQISSFYSTLTKKLYFKRRFLE